MTPTAAIQPGLFDARPACQQHSRTSIEAAKSIKGEAKTLRAMVRFFIESEVSRGATDEEIQISLEMNPSTQRPRRIELVKAGLVVDSGQTRKTLSGRQATVWRCS